MPRWSEKILKYNPGEKSLKAPFSIYLDLECILKEVQSCQNNPEKSYTEKKATHELSGGAMFIKCSFDEKENKLDYYREKDCIEKLKERVMKISYYKKKKKWCHYQAKLLSFMKNKKYVIYVKRGFRDNDKNKKKVRDHCHQTGKFREAAYSKCNLRYKEFKEIPVIIHNGGYDTHFIINQLAIEFKGELNCIGDNMEKYITFFVPIKKRLNNGKTVTHK